MSFKIISVVWLILIFAGLFALYSMKFFYGEVGDLLWIHMAITAGAFLFNIYCFRMYSVQVWGPVTIINSFVIGLMPYKLEIPRILELLSDPDTELSKISEGLPRFLGVTVDSLFFIGATLLLLLLAAAAVTQNK